MSRFLDQLPEWLASSAGEADFWANMGERLHDIETMAGTSDDLYLLTSQLESRLVELGVIDRDSSRVLHAQRSRPGPLTE